MKETSKTNKTYGRVTEGYFKTSEEEAQKLKEEIKKIEEVESQHTHTHTHRIQKGLNFILTLIGGGVQHTGFRRLWRGHTRIGDPSRPLSRESS